jgi:tRNA threonylcarbamoyladenosine biosynthesis protein TsaB
MILLLDTSTPLCKLTLIEGDWRYNDEWQADRALAKHLLRYLHDQLQANGKTFQDISGIGVFRGPGSFTGLRIGITVLNTIADAQQLPIVGTESETWQAQAVEKLNNHQDEKMILPLYGSQPHITIPRK